MPQILHRFPGGVVARRVTSLLHEELQVAGGCVWCLSVIEEAVDYQFLSLRWLGGRGRYVISGTGLRSRVRYGWWGWFEAVDANLLFVGSTVRVGTDNYRGVGLNFHDAVGSGGYWS